MNHYRPRKRTNTSHQVSVSPHQRNSMIRILRQSYQFSNDTAYDLTMRFIREGGAIEPEVLRAAMQAGISLPETQPITWKAALS